jgi:hypothetical protein
LDTLEEGNLEEDIPVEDIVDLDNQEEGVLVGDILGMGIVDLGNQEEEGFGVGIGCRGLSLVPFFYYKK